MPDPIPLVLSANLLYVQLKSLRITIFVLLCGLLASCSYHYDQGQELEAQGRWEEAAIEYRIAYVDDPEDVEIREALERANLKVADDNFRRYQHYLQEHKFAKAYQRLEAGLAQNPNHSGFQAERPHWTRVLIAGRVHFEFQKLRGAFRLADEMQLQVQINTPSGALLTTELINDTGLFFVEDLNYQHPPEFLTRYSLNSIGLRMKRRTATGFLRRNYQRFINFRELAPLAVQGKLKNGSTETRVIQDHSERLQETSLLTAAWVPPRLLNYQLQLNDTGIQILGTPRLEFAPELLYLHQTQQRAFVDFGTYRVELNPETERWGIVREPATPATDHLPLLARNLALNPYLYYDSAYRFTH